MGRMGLLIVLSWLLLAQVRAAPVPPALEPWRDWVLHGTAQALCPRLDDARPDSAACRWPGELQLEVDAGGARFVQDWTLYAPQQVPLPGDADQRPVEVRVDGRAAPVVIDAAGRPWLALEAGTHRISGRFAWPRRPSTLALPPQVARVALRVDGAVVPLPQRDADHALVLGRTAGTEGDALQVEAYRLLADDVPPWLVTRIQLAVAGRAREQLLGPFLPAGYVPVAVDGELPLRWEPDGRLRVQLRPGGWSLTVIARAPADSTRFVAPVVPAPWAEQELWQFRAAPELRLAQLEGVPGVDPQQAGVPDWSHGVGDAVHAHWQSLFDDAGRLPTYLFAPGAEASLAVNLRGLPAQRPPRLALQRELWLDFDGDEFIGRDRVSGDSGGAARFDMRAPWRLEQARRGEINLLVTQGTAAGTSGIEWRDTQVGFEAGTRITNDGMLPAAGWDTGFDSASLTLNLAPGYRLLGARGADAASGSWIERWSLLDLFLCSVVLLLGWRVRPVLVAVLLPWLAWSWHEPDAPRLSLVLLLALLLLLRHVPAGRWRSLLRLLQRASVALVVVWSLLFAATQLRLALHPQLERDAVAASGTFDARNAVSYGGQVAMEAQAPMPSAPPPPPARASSKGSDQTLDQIQVTGTRIMRMDPFQYPADAIPQAGSARPDWHWHRHTLRWDGPLAADDTLDLWISPPWLTRLLRVLAVVLLAAALALLLRGGRSQRVAGTTAAAIPALALMLSFAAVVAPSPAVAQATPDAALLEELRERLLARDAPCRPRCAGLESAGVRADGAQLRLWLEAHAQARTAWPLPRSGEGQPLLGLRVDGAEAPVLQHDGGSWVLLERGVHRVELRFGSADARWRIRFPLPPAAFEVPEADFDASGLDDGRLIGDTLELLRRIAPHGDGGNGATRDETGVPPFVRVRRHLSLDQQWTVLTEVERIAPLRGGITVPVPLLPGELPLEGAPPQRDRMLLVTLAADVDRASWSSRLTPAPEYSLSTGDGRSYSEEWRLDVSPLLHAQTEGLPQVGEPGGGAARSPRFLPLPGETLRIAVSRPETVQGATLAIEGVNLTVNPGQRARDARLEFTLRATRAGQHRLPLPDGAELLGLWIDGREQPRVLEGGAIMLPVRATAQQVAVSWREPVGIGWRSVTPPLDLGANAANLRLQLQLPQDRWLLATHGPGIGPAVLYWSYLAVLVLVAAALARWGGTVLRFHHWLLLGLGFSTVSWIAGAVVAGWLLLLAWRGRRHAAPSGYRFAAIQVLLAATTLAALSCLVAAIPYGLLASPDMHVTGNGSWATRLNWFLDRSDSLLPSATAYSVPMWVYKTAILLWALWLANALLGWLRWGWDCFGRQGRWYWPPRKPRASNTPVPVGTDAASPGSTPVD